jgi:DNA-damage-inducible protein D
MSDLELIFSMLGEASTTEHRNACVRGRSRGRGTRQGETRRWRASQIARSRDTRGFTENRRAAREGGSVAGHARKELEKKTGRKVVTSDNYLALAPTAPKRKRLPRKKRKPDG